MEIRVAETAMHLHRERVAGRFVRFERFDQDGSPAGGKDVEVQATAVGHDRLQAGKASFPGRADFSGDGLLALLFHDALDPHDRLRAAAGELAELVPSRSIGRVPVVDQQPLDAPGVQ